MIPLLNTQAPVASPYSDYLQALEKSEFKGEISTNFSSRLIHATDNSIYQILPQAVVHPKDHDDVVTMILLANRPEFAEITFAARGGGTGTNGQSLSEGLIVDCTKFMTQILELNVEERWVRVQPGVVLDALNQYLSEFGLFFAPTVSPSNRATIGGMISMDAAGKGSRIYGKTSDHTLKLKTVLSNGHAWESVPLNPAELTKVKAECNGIGEIHALLEDIITTKQELIEKQFPKMDRFMTGYNLSKVMNGDQQFNLNYVLCGSEGSLGIVTEAKLNLEPIPKHKTLVVVKYTTFLDALDDAERLLKAEPVAVETIDERILTLAKTDEIYYQVKDFIGDEDGHEVGTVNMVEYSGHDLEKIQKNVKNLEDRIKKNRGKEGHPFGFFSTDNPKEIKSLWSLRAKGVGLLANTQGAKKPLPFIEDTGVPPQNVGAFIREFRQLLDSRNLEYAMFGHIDAGVLHVRPLLNAQDETDEAMIRMLSDEVSLLVKKHGGILWAEHGKGFRSEYTPLYFGKELYQDLRRIKAAFDPHNRMNPGKVVTPITMDDPGVKVEAPLRAHQEKQIEAKFQTDFAEVISCNGNGACYNVDPKHVMCPSSKITKDRIHSPKGRAAVMREWLRQLSSLGIPSLPRPQEANQWDSFLDIKQWVKRLQNTIAIKYKGQYDYSHEAYDAMMGCLSCKGCTSQCPVHIDVPKFRAEFLYHYYARYLRPVRDYLIASLEFNAPTQAKVAGLINGIFDNSASQHLARKLLKIVDLPLLSTPTLDVVLKERNIPVLEPPQLSQLTDAEKQNSILLYQDAFTTFYDKDVVVAAYDFLTYLGFHVTILPFKPNGKPLHVKGFLGAFYKVAKKQVEFLNEVSKAGIPIIGIDPSVVLTYRDEYLHILEVDKLDFQVHLLQEWLVENWDRVDRKVKEQISPKSKSSRVYRLLGHCMEKTGALASQTQWKQLFAAFGIELELVNVGCCGMAGTFGHEAEHLEESKGIYELSWKSQVPATEEERDQLLVTGYSCRTQVQRFDQFKPKHPVQSLLQEVRFDNSMQVSS